MGKITLPWVDEIRKRIAELKNQTPKTDTAKIERFAKMNALKSLLKYGALHEKRIEREFAEEKKKVEEEMKKYVSTTNAQNK